MSRKLLGATILGLVLSACSSTPIDTSTAESTAESEAGSINLPLTTQVKDVTYRLRLASFLITGEPLGAKPRLVKPLDDATVHNEKLPVGAYSILLQKGWVLEKRGPKDTAYTAVTATLITPNPVSVTVDGKVVGDAFFGFTTTSGDVALGDGSVNIRIGVQDCASYEGYTAALGELTVQCRGTLDPKDYAVNKDGYLAPTFEKCTRTDKLQAIKQLLSLQYRTARLPFAKACMAGKYDAFAQSFASSGVTTCPTWELEKVTNDLNPNNIAELIRQLPVIPPEKGLADDGTIPAVVAKLKTTAIYKVSLPAGIPGQKCQSPAECALACSGGFPGYATGITSASEVNTDPPAWLLDNQYAASTADPFLRAGYYHPMSWYGGAPGVQFGEYARYSPCGVNADGVQICKPEMCSFFAGVHKQTTLQADCLDKADIDTCISFCGPLLP